jgi:putative drug exporter of the RND superfamily
VVETTAHRAVAYDRSPSIPGLLAVAPIPNGAGVSAPAVTPSPLGAAGLLAGAQQHTSAIVTYLDFRSDATLERQVSDARAYAARYLTHVAGVTGPVAAQYEQGQIIDRDLPWVELFMVLAIALIVGVRFRSVIAPIAALACAGAAYVLATRIVAWGAQRTGITVPQDAALGSPDLVYFVPFAAGVLLVSLGSDYNVFVVGRIWEEARALPARDAVAVAAPRASGAITTAGVALAASFGLLAVIPLEQFRQLAIIMAVGVMLDSIIVRSFLVPALVALTGRLGMWPGHQRVRVAARRPPELPDASR